LFTFRDVYTEDFTIISTFPQSESELFYMFPKGKFPLEPEQLIDAATERLLPTVILMNHNVIGYSNFYDLSVERDCWLGNVIIDPRFRGHGAGAYLIQSMKERAKNELKVKELKLVCHNVNTTALLFYFKQGFKPFDMKIIQDHNNHSIAGIKMSLELF
jgi:GNAT superfamily N-acetyltransferase